MLQKGKDRTRKEILSENLSAYFRKNRFTAKKVSELTGIRESTISSWMRQVSVPRDENLQKVADLLGVTISDLYEDQGPEGRRRTIYSIAQQNVCRAMDESALVNAVATDLVRCYREHKTGRLELYASLLRDESGSGGIKPSVSSEEQK